MRSVGTRPLDSLFRLVDICTKGEMVSIRKRRSSFTYALIRKVFMVQRSLTAAVDGLVFLKDHRFVYIQTFIFKGFYVKRSHSLQKVHRGKKRRITSSLVFHWSCSDPDFVASNKPTDANLTEEETTGNTRSYCMNDVYMLYVAVPPDFICLHFTRSASDSVLFPERVCASLCWSLSSGGIFY